MSCLVIFFLIHTLIGSHAFTFNIWTCLTNQQPCSGYTTYVHLTKKLPRWYGQHTTNTLLIVCLCVFAEYTHLIRPGAISTSVSGLPLSLPSSNDFCCCFGTGLQTSSGTLLCKISSLNPHEKPGSVPVVHLKRSHLCFVSISWSLLTRGC